jgi:hypothetical protein
MKLSMIALSALVLATPTASGQTPDDVQLSVAGYQLAANGAETHAGVSRGTYTLKIGQPTLSVFSMTGCGYFSVTVPPNSFREDAVVGWRVEVTPLKIVKHAVTFRLRWVRALDRGTALEPASEDIEVTLKPGESRPIDTVSVVQASAKTIDGKPCTTKSASLRVSADFPDFDRRLFGAELWLIERSPDGKEQTRAQSIRGLFNRAIPFYFDSVIDGEKRLDIFGKLVVDPIQGSFDITLEAIRAVPNSEPETGYQSVRWFRSTVQIKPNEVVDVALPPPDDKGAVFADRSFSIRIKPMRIR